MHNSFIEAIHSRRKIELHFYSKEDGRIIVRKCAPMDFGPSRRTKTSVDRYHLWDYDSDEKQHNLPLLPNQIKEMKILDETFDPAEFVTWNTTISPWFVRRDWGQFS